jgi:hypothetical protein
MDPERVPGLCGLKSPLCAPALCGYWLKVSAKALLPFDRLKKSLEIALPEALGALALDDLVEQRRPILDRLAENLEQVPLVITIYQNA